MTNPLPAVIALLPPAQPALWPHSPPAPTRTQRSPWRCSSDSPAPTAPAAGKTAPRPPPARGPGARLDCSRHAGDDAPLAPAATRDALLRLHRPGSRHSSRHRRTPPRWNHGPACTCAWGKALLSTTIWAPRRSSAPARRARHGLSTCCWSSACPPAPKAPGGQKYCSKHAAGHMGSAQHAIKITSQQVV